MTRHTPPRLGSFLTYEIWQEAASLLNLQIAQRKRNKHYNTVSMIYYDRLGGATQAVATEQYYNERVANNFLYGLEEEFAALPYLVPKAGLGLRDYAFLTYPLRVAYYAVGLYLLHLSYEHLQDRVDRCPRIHSYYGGKLALQGGKLNATAANISYRKYYKEFRDLVRKETAAAHDRKVVLHLDLENYYNQISIPILLRTLTHWVRPETRTDLNYDQVAVEQISSFFQFLMAGKGGIPQEQTNIISSLIGHLYLTFADLCIDDEIRRFCPSVQSHAVIRYVDDIFLFITFAESVDQKSREGIVAFLAPRIADALFHRLGLKANSKSKLYWLCDAVDRDALLSSLRKVSPDYYWSGENDDAPQKKIDNIYHELTKLKASRIDSSFKPGGDLQEEILKEIYDPRVDQLVQAPPNRAALDSLFAAFNFELVKARPLEIIVTLMKSDTAKSAFREFLLEKSDLSTGDIQLILTYLGQVDFTDDELIAKLREAQGFAKIVDVFQAATIPSPCPGYHDLPWPKIQRLCNEPSVIEQVRLRVMNERAGEYSVALNHLLNEIHAICRLVDTRNAHKYDEQRVISFLDSRQVPHEVQAAIRNLFDRRNINQVSHPARQRNGPWGVTREEYCDYRSWVGKCLAMIL